MYIYIHIYIRTTIFTIAGVSANVYRFLINHLIITHDHVEENKCIMTFQISSVVLL